MTEIIALVSTITALCSVLLSPLVSMWVVNKQSRVSVLSGNRQVWINSLRDQISEFIAILAVVHSGNWSERTGKELDDELKQLILVGSKIKLMLNFNEEDHMRLAQLIVEVSYTLPRKTGNAIGNRTAAEISGEFLTLAQSILKREWERVKQSV